MATINSLDQVKDLEIQLSRFRENFRDSPENKESFQHAGNYFTAYCDADANCIIDTFGGIPSKDVLIEFKMMLSPWFIKVYKSDYKVESYLSGYFGIVGPEGCVFGGDSANSDDYDSKYINDVFDNWDGILVNGGRFGWRIEADLLKGYRLDKNHADESGSDLIGYFKSKQAAIGAAKLSGSYTLQSFHVYEFHSHIRLEDLFEFCLNNDLVGDVEHFTI